jgi:glycosyltransferase involved in cell wall biosynthesis
MLVDDLVSVVVPVYDDYFRFEMTMRALLKHKCQQPFEIIVVNDGGTDRIRQCLEGIKCLTGDSVVGLQYHWLGPATEEFRAAATRNLGLKAAMGARTVFLDCDTVPAAGCLDAHLGAPESALLGLRRRVHMDDVNDLALPIVSEGWYEAHVWAEDERTRPPFDKAYQALPGGPEPHIVFWSCNLSLPTKAVMDIGGFDEAYVGWGGEDEDLGIRLVKTGMEIHRTNSTVYHLDHPARTPRTASQLLQVTRNQGIVRNGGPLEQIQPRHL